MAKLKAHGHELLRLSKEVNIDPATHTFVGGVDVGLTLTVWERTTRSYRSDGHIMEKRDVQFRQDSASAQYGSEFHSYGWKLYKKLRKGATVTPQEFATKVRASLEAAQERGESTRWVVEYDATAVKR